MPSPTTAVSIVKLAELGGFFAAHAVWSISDRETLIPILATESADGKRQMNRMAHDKLEDAVAFGKQQLQKNPAGALRAVLIYDGRITLEGVKHDALILEAREYGAGARSFTMAILYTHGKDKAAFAVHRPKLVAYEGPKEEMTSVADLFFKGVDAHKEGATVWNAHLDQSK